MRIQYNGESKILKRLAELVNQKADKSDIPAVGNGTLSVQRNGNSVGTFSANATENVSVNIPVPEKISELENDAGYTKNTGTYIKPSAGIPKSDLASGVQASLGKADTALQKHQDISGKLDKTGDASNTTVAFSAASARESVKTGEKLSVLFGKIAKWFADLKTVAFTGSYNDLANKPTIPDISGKQDKLTAGANITISGNTISAKDTTYSNASTTTAGLMTAADKAKLDGMDSSQYLPLHGTADIAKTLSNGSMRYGWCANGDASANSGYRWFCVGKLPKSQLGYLTEILYLNVCGGYGLFGVLRVFVRTDSTGKNVEQMNVTWLARDATTSRPQFKLVAIESDTGVSFELWCYTTARLQQMFCNVIADLNLTGGLYNRWALETHSAADAKNATTVGTKSVTDIDISYASQATALTESAWTAVPATGADSTSERDLKYLVMGNTVYVQGYLKFSAGNNNPKCGTLPSSARPNGTLYFTGWDTDGVPAAYPIVVNSVGIIMLLNPTSTAYWFKSGRAYRFNFSYHIN